MSGDVEREDVEVAVLSFSELLESDALPLAVDTYQRGFVWNDEKITQLIEDLSDYQSIPHPCASYYMGSILLHRHDAKQRRFVIDGQQRLTALCILFHRIRNELPSGFELSYSLDSERRIQRAHALFSRSIRNVTADIFEQIAFTVISVKRVDLAFTFFDTQNNRGLPLHATDLLKAFHLRAVASPDSAQQEEFRAMCARRWEGIQHGKPLMSREEGFTASLFSKYLWRARSWQGKQVPSASHDGLLLEFESETWKTEGDAGSVPLYRSRHSRLGAALTVERDGTTNVHTEEIPRRTLARDLPFAIRQPIQQGLGFFLYTEKYAAQLRWLTTEAVESREIARAREVLHCLMKHNSVFLREIYLLGLLMYSDQFGDEKLGAFSLWMEHALGAVRLKKHQVRFETAQKFFKDPSMNLLDVIAGSFRPEQVIRHLEDPKLSQPDVYEDDSNLSGAKGVQAIYRNAALKYYGKEGSLARKSDWVTAKAREVL